MADGAGQRLSGNWQAKRSQWVEERQIEQQAASSPQAKVPADATASPPGAPATVAASSPPSSGGGAKWQPKERQSWIPSSDQKGTTPALGMSPSAGKGTWKAGKSAKSWIRDGEGSHQAAGGEAPAVFDREIADVDVPLRDILTSEELEALSKAIPKVELHAHLSGTVRETTLRELLLAQGGDPTTSRFCLDALHVHDSLEETWKQTVEAFATIRRLTAGDSAILQRIVMEAVEGYAAAGCVYYEMRTGLKPLPDKKSFLELLGSAIKRAEGKHGITVRLLVSVDRGASVQDSMETIDAAIAAFESQNKDHGIVVGVEMGGNPLAGDWALLRPHFDRARAAGLKVSLHFAENKGEDKEHSAILDFVPERVGHAVFMSGAIADRLVTSSTPVEVCLTCHEAFYKVPMRENVFVSLTAKKHPVVLCCDNACLLRTSIAQEYRIAIETFGLTARQLDDLVIASVGAIFADGKTRGRVMEACTQGLAEIFPTLHGRQLRAPAQPPVTSSLGAGGIVGAVGAAAAALLVGAVVFAKLRN